MRARFLWAAGGVAAVPAQALAVVPASADVQSGAAIAAAWLAAGVWAVARAVRARRETSAARDWGLRLRALLATAPGAYLIVGADGAAVCSDSLRGWLGLGGRVTSLDDLAPQPDAGIHADDFALLRDAIERLSLTGDSFDLLVRLVGQSRVLGAQGRSAAPELAGERALVVWFRDATERQTAYATLRREKARLAESLAAASGLLEAAPFPIWRRDHELKLCHVNAAYARAVQAADAGDAVANAVELADGGPAPPTEAARRARDLAQPQTRDEPVIIGDARRVLQIVDVPLGAAGVGGFAIDVTDREEARAERDRLQRAQTDTLNRLSAGVARFAGDRSLVFHNRAFRELFKLDEPFLAERPEFDRVLERMREMRRLPESRDFPSWRRERRAWFTDAVVAVEEVWALPNSSVLRVIAQPHPEGGLLLIFEDRTEQLRLASARDTLMRVQEATLNNLHEGVAVFGADGRVQLWNTRFAAMFGLDAELLATRPHIDTLLDRTARLYVDLEQAMRVRDILRAMTAPELRAARGARVELHDGRVLDFGAVPLPDGNALFTYLDVTDSQRIETALRDRNEALEAADRLKSAFVANVSYELRTPLTAIIGFGEMLSTGYAGELSERQRDYVGAILSSSSRLELLINDILDLATNEAGGVVLDIGDVGIEPLIRSVAAMSTEAVRGRGLALEVAVEPGIGTIAGDERRLKQVLHNLLANAVRFTPPGGWVAIRATGTTVGVRLTVADSGIGILPAEQALVFDRFRKGSNARSQGAGLGLALVRQFVELHGGRVELHSRISEGTSVTIHLPRCQHAQRDEAAE